ncbi:2-oxoacid dehydrogenases acyltransferase family protein [Mycobacterium xenopi 4042]|uniref:2-oxoacid dehydrogenases acyltransferase family protein n=1 Tax=Mycobacterium xenopi 4042 TaxID=1299334 RepID=X8APQ5_MYCXE|nr:2-oxoacid dehydrogenases acyltransferase family protein [Mycobacterium xenopi 4042]
MSNYGALGVDEGVPVINYPEAAILGMGSLRPGPWPSRTWSSCAPR